MARPVRQGQGEVQVSARGNARPDAFLQVQVSARGDALDDFLHVTPELPPTEQSHSTCIVKGHVSPLVHESPPLVYGCTTCPRYVGYESDGQRCSEQILPFLCRRRYLLQVGINYD